VITTDANAGSSGGGTITPPALLDVETLASHVLAHMNVPSSTKTTTTALDALVRYLRGESKQSQNQQPKKKKGYHQHHQQQSVTVVPPKVLFIIDGCDNLLVRQQENTESNRTKANAGSGWDNLGQTGYHSGGFRVHSPPLSVREGSSRTSEKGSYTSLYEPTTISCLHTPVEVQRISSDLSQLSSSSSTPPPVPASRSSSNSLDSANRPPSSTNATITASTAFSVLIDAIMGRSQSTRYITCSSS